MFFFKNTNNTSDSKEKLQVHAYTSLIIFLIITREISDNKEKGQVG